MSRSRMELYSFTIHSAGTYQLRIDGLEPGVDYSRDAILITRQFRGALVLHRLREELGDELFWRGIRRYVADRAGKGARSEALRRALEAVSVRDLKPFFERWVYRSAFDL